MKIKINWGWGIALAYSLFACGIIYLIVLCSHQNIDLVSKNYYEKELKFQQQYEKEKNALALTQPLKFDINAIEKKLAVTFPESKQDAALKGQILFQKPDDAKLDRTVSINTSELLQEISYSDWKKGLWKVEVNWSDGEKDYYKESYLKLN